jgi:hypothetical protein
MGLTLNANEARKADNFSTIIRESGKYIGTITRAQKLLSRNNVEGVGLSFKTDDGESASYLDLYTVKPGGETLRGWQIVQSILCCTRTKNAEEGPITFEAWDREERKMVQVTEPGYPALMGKRIGLVLQREIGTNQNTGEDSDRLQIVGVFEATTGLTSSEILDGKTKPERIERVVKMIQANPVRDTRKKAPTRPVQPQAPDTAAFDDDIPF